MDSHDALVHTLYDAAVDPAAWEDVPKAIAEGFGGVAVYLTDGIIADPFSFRVNSYRFSNARLFESGFKQEDHNDPDINLGFRASLRVPLLRGHHGHRQFNVANEQQRLYFQKCFLDYGTPYVRLFVVNRDSREGAGGFISYSERHNPFEDDNSRRFDTVLSHLRRAVEIRSKLEIAHRTANTLGRQFDTLSTGVFVLNRAGQVVYRNQSAEDLCNAGAGVTLRNNVLSICDARVQRQFRARLATLYDAGDRGLEAPLQIGRGAGDVPLLAWVYPTIGFGAGELPGSAYACVLIRDPMADMPVADAPTLQATFDLTPAEARVAQMTPLSLTLGQMAQRLGVSPNTVKTHLTSVRGKLMAHSTAEVAQIVARVRG